MGATLQNIIMIMGSLCVFIYGMKLMSEGIQRAAGNSLRSVLRTITKNRFRGLVTGLLTTTAVQSSSATTVMTVSLVNAGLITLTESVGVMLGANIGTTSTAWIITLLDFRFDVYQLTLPLFLVGLPLILSKRGKLRFYGEFVIGVAILFLGLSFLRETVPDINQNEAFTTWIRSLADSGIAARLLFVVIGAFMTIIIQSSSAAIVLTMTMCMKGWIPFELGACLVMGENIGTTITAEIASLVGNVHARRSARVHSLFNILGVLWMVIVLPYFLDGITWLQMHVFNLQSPYDDLTATDFGLALFHTSFNLVNAIMAMLLTGYLVKAAMTTVRVRAEDDEVPRLKFFNEGIRTPELATIELKKEIAKYSAIIRRMHSFSRQLFNEVKRKPRIQLIDRIDKYETITDNIEREIADYITNLSKEVLSFSTSLNLRSMLNICNDLERIGDSYYKISQEISYKTEQKIWINPTQRNNLNTFIDYISSVLEALHTNLETDRYQDADTLSTKKQIQAAEIYYRHIKDPVVTETVADEEDVDDIINLKGAKVYDNILYQYNKILDHSKNIVDYINGEI